MKFTDLVDINAVRGLCQSFTALTGAVTAILDLEGTILVATGWQRICTQFHRVCPQTAARCRQSDTILAGRLQTGERYNVYRCQNGLVDVAVPIEVGGEHIANFFTGQFFFNAPDIDYFRRQAREFGFDESGYLTALAQAPVFTEAYVHKMMDFLTRLAQLIGEMGLARTILGTVNQEIQQRQTYLAELVFTRTAELSTAKEEAKSASRAKSAFLTTMSHEFKTPLNVITNASYGLRHTDMTLQQQHQLDDIDAASGRLLAMVNTLLDLSNLEVGQLTLDHIDFWLEDVMNQFVDVVGVKAEAKEIELVFDLSPQIPTALIGDPLRLGQILCHLGDNAVKFNAPGGEILVRVKAQECSQDELEILFSIHDTGIGLSEEQQHSLFKPFDHADPSRLPSHHGRGLGLLIAKHLIKLMDGFIWVESTLGQGSCFRFTVRVKRQATDVRLLAQAMARRLLPRQILVIDDNANARRAVHRILDTLGFNVLSVATGAAALQQITSLLPSALFDLVFIDWHLPDMDGLTIIDALQMLSLPAPLLIVMMVTPRHEDAARQASQTMASHHQIKIVGFLTKPVTLAPLLDMMRRVLEIPPDHEPNGN
jgi:signal transduction histidine kinase